MKMLANCVEILHSVFFS